MDLTATVIIATKNRRDEVVRAVESAVNQTAAPEVIVLDDASDDGTAELIRERFPGVRVERSETSIGAPAQRNRGVRLAGGDVIISVDDDVLFTSPDIVGQTLDDFGPPRIGAVAIPFINVNVSDDVWLKSPGDGVWVGVHFRGCSCAFRRDLFLRLGGFRETLVHQGEESDFCLRLIDSGRVVRLGRSEPVHHFDSPRRVRKRQTFYTARNNVLNVWTNVPPANMPLHLAATTFNTLRAGLREGTPGWTLQGLLAGYAAAGRGLRERASISKQGYRAYRALKHAPPMPLAEAEKLLPPLRG